MKCFAPLRREFIYSLCWLLLLCFRAGARRAKLGKTEKPVVDSQAVPYIIGAEAPEGRFPYVCSLSTREEERHACGGVLVRSQLPVVRCGIHRLDEHSPEKKFAAEASFVHESWTGSVADGYDIAVLKLKRETNLTLPLVGTQGDDELAIGKQLSALGWGLDENKRPSNSLKIANLLYVTPSACKEAQGDKVKPFTVCAGLTDENTCQGDSGGPLLIPNRPSGNLSAGTPGVDLIIGITSAGPEDCTDDSPTLYTNIGFFWSWVLEKISEPPAVEDDEPKVSPEQTDATDSNGHKDSSGKGKRGSAKKEDATKKKKSGTTKKEDAAEKPKRRSAKKGGAEEKEKERTVKKEPKRSKKLSPADRLSRAIKSIVDDDAKALEAALSKGVDPDSVYYDRKQSKYPLNKKSTLLHWAAAYDASDCAEVLVDYDADVNSGDKDKLAPLHVAAITGSASIAQILLKSKAKVDATDKSRKTPLHKTAEFGSISTANVLIKQGADVGAKDSSRWTPLHEAAYHGQPRIAKVLLDNGADLDTVDFDEWTPLHVAAHYGHADVVQLLLDYGADANAIEIREQTPLHFAAQNKHTRAAKILLDYDADVAAIREDGRTPLHMAVLGGAAEIVKMLLEVGADVDAVSNFKSTPLHLTAQEGHSEIAHILLDSGAYVDAVREDGFTPLHVASMHGTVEILQILLEHGANINAVTGLGDSPLHVAALFGQLGSTQVLVAAGASKTSTNHDGETPLDRLCYAGIESDCSATTRPPLTRLLTP